MHVRKAKAVLIVECFQRAVLDADSQLRLIHMFGAVLSGSQVITFLLLQHCFKPTHILRLSSFFAFINYTHSENWNI